MIIIIIVYTMLRRPPTAATLTAKDIEEFKERLFDKEKKKEMDTIFMGRSIHRQNDKK